MEKRGVAMETILDRLACLYHANGKKPEKGSLSCGNVRLEETKSSSEMQFPCHTGNPVHTQTQSPSHAPSPHVPMETQLY